MGRVPYVVEDDLPEEYEDLITSSLQPGKRVNVYRAVGNNPEVLAGLRAYLGKLWSDTGLSAYRRELVILAIAREFDSAYEWHQHVNVARNMDIPDEECRAIADGNHEVFDDDDRLVLRYALAVARGDVDDDLHEEISEVYDDSTVVGIAGLGGGYAMLAQLIDAFDVDIEDDFVGWDLQGN